MKIKTIGILIIFIIFNGCIRPVAKTAPTVEKSKTADTKIPELTTTIPLTTSSQSALENYLKGRSLSDKLRGQESIQFYQQAVKDDPTFAVAYLNLALVSPTAKEFFRNLELAKTHADIVSEGERLWIKGLDAGVNGYQLEQRRLYKELVNMYPGDERAHNLLGNHYFGQQEYKLAMDEYNQSISINPSFSQSYNQAGYAYRFLGNYTQSEIAFKKYIDLIPDDPNPLDSYAELLMKIGKFAESIEQYRKALSIDPNFVASHLGIATNLNFLESHDQAIAQLQQLLEMARNDGEKRAAIFAMSVSYSDQGDFSAALDKLDQQYNLALNIGDANNMAGDLVAMGNIYLEMNSPDSALAKFEAAVDIVEKSDLTDQVKENTRRLYYYNAARAAIARNDLTIATALSQQFMAKVIKIENPFQIKLAYELEGMIALKDQRFADARSSLLKSNLQNPYNIYRLALAYQGLGEADEAAEQFRAAKEFNGLNNLNYAFVRNNYRL